MSENSGGHGQEENTTGRQEPYQHTYRRRPRGNHFSSSHQSNARRPYVEHNSAYNSGYHNSGYSGSTNHSGYHGSAYHSGYPGGYGNSGYPSENSSARHFNGYNSHASHNQDSRQHSNGHPPRRRQHRPYSSRQSYRRDPKDHTKGTHEDSLVSKTAISDNQATSLRQQIESNTYECMVCYDTLNAFCATYSCFQCFNIFHLTCIRQWASSKLSDTSLPEGSTADWRCPACQVSSTSLPFRYFCFCGSVVNPEFKSFTLPHSCGEKCTRSKDSCTHPCPELCHPGKCPACPASVIVYCSCATESKRVKCSQKDASFQCSKVCGKLLNCKKHFCETVCHSGACDDCPESNELTCYCGKSSKEIPCGFEKESISSDQIGYWSCFEKCSKTLTCDNHSCLQRCHFGPCGPCETDASAIVNCPCGKTRLDRISQTARQTCLEPIPTCKKICKKPLNCGTAEMKHLCQGTCHNGPCPPCLDRSIVMCACESSSESMLCSDIPDGGLRCDKVCYKKKSCGRHRCNTKCCLEDNHICMIPCGKMLTCKKHKCEDLCHRGHCMPCLLSTFTEVYCTCGRTKLEPPVACGTDPPKCNELCGREHSCPHPVTHTCHYEDQCPPCAQLVNKVCMGGHTVRFNVPCHVQDVSCGDVCKKQLPCGMHTCERWCHKGACVTPNCTCELPCTKPRILCTHPCNAKCHSGKPCPQNVCFEKVKVLCDCKRRTVLVLCFKGATLTSETPDLTRYNSKLKSVGLIVTQQDLLDYLKSGIVKCDEKCRVEERNQKLAEGLGLKDVPIDSLIAPTYSEYLISEFKTKKEFIIEIENVFSDLISKYKKKNQALDNFNKVKFIYHDFKVMNKDKRRTVHELAAVYKITSQSMDEEPHRNVQVRIGWDATEPSIKLSQYSQRRVIGGVGAKPVQKPASTEKKDVPNLQALSLGTMQKEEIVFDSWEDIEEI